MGSEMCIRDRSWIDFNKRVLLTGMEKDYKVLDQIKFFSIFSNNLDEFFMVRVASLKAQVEAGIMKSRIIAPAINGALGPKSS